MTNYFLIFVSTLILAFGATPVARRTARRLGVVDQPSQRKLHVVATPLLGGVAVYLAFIVALLLLGNRFYFNQMAGIVLGATMVSFLGLWDDRFGMSPWVKLAGQILAGSVMLVSNVRISFLPWPWVNAAATLLWMVVITNAFNLLDNMDGLSGGVALIAGRLLLALCRDQQTVPGRRVSCRPHRCLRGIHSLQFQPGQHLHGRHGQPVPRFYSGCGWHQAPVPGQFGLCHLDGATSGVRLTSFDTSLVIVSRLRRGLNPLTTPGKDHVSHRLARVTNSPREAVLICYLLACACGVVATFVTEASIPEGYAVGAMMLALGLIGIWRMEQLPH